MSTATVLTHEQANEVLDAPEPGLRRCNIVRFLCGKCGDVTAYLPVHADPPTECDHCHLPVAITAIARGWTKHDLPYIGARPIWNAVGSPRTRRRGGKGQSLSAEDVQVIRKALDQKSATVVRLAIEYGVTRRTIYNALKRDK